MRVRRAACAVVAGVLAGVVGCTGGTPQRAAPPSDGTIRFVAYDFSENQVLVDVYAEAVRRAGLPVAVDEAGATREVVEPALEQGVVDVVIDYLGTLTQFVSCNDRAWHAGVSSWRGRERCNDFSIGIELEGTDDRAYAGAQYTRLAAMLLAVKRRYPVEAAVGHSDVAPGRKTDPGPAFDWDRLSRLTGAPRLSAGAFSHPPGDRV